MMYFFACDSHEVQLTIKGNKNNKIVKILICSYGWHCSHGAKAWKRDTIKFISSDGQRAKDDLLIMQRADI